MRRSATPTALPIEALDVYATKRANAPINIFIHGGAWRGGLAKDSGYPAELFVHAGAHYVVPDFINVTEANGSLIPMARAGGPKPYLIARKRRPMFGADVSLANVNLFDCLLVGNVLQDMKFWNVDWPARRGRYALRDEIVYRSSGGLLPSELREACQVLKQKYQDEGDHVRAGDFHYGEMEMKRREYGVPRRWTSWEFAYWMLSGYGVGHWRSLVILVALLSGCAAFYYCTRPEAFTDGFGEALRYSISVAALQRPEVPREFGEPQKWIHVAEAVLGPLQIALFVLALRMRLKR